MKARVASRLDSALVRTYPGCAANVRDEPRQPLSKWTMFRAAGDALSAA